MDHRTSDLIVLDKMCELDKDIRMAKLPDNFVNCRRVKAGGHLTIGVDDSCASILMNMALGAKDYGAALIIYKREHFDEIKTELKNGIPLPHFGDPCLCGKVTEGCTLDRETLYNRVIELQGKLEAVKPKSTLKEMFPGEFSGALPGSIESKWAAEKNTLTPEQVKQFDPAYPGARMHYVPDRSELERKYRYRLWMAYPDPTGSKYGDDGEMQRAGLDFLRAPLETLENAVDEALLKSAAKKPILTEFPEKPKEFAPVVGKCGVHAPGTAITDWTCDLDRGHSGRHSNGRLGREHEWDDNGHLYYF
jgi:hypothetical protein